MNYWTGVIGAWIISDSIYSYVLYAHSQSWRGDRQNFKKDNWVRLVRLICGIALIINGCFMNKEIGGRHGQTKLYGMG